MVLASGLLAMGMLFDEFRNRFAGVPCEQVCLVHVAEKSVFVVLRNKSF